MYSTREDERGARLDQVSIATVNIRLECSINVQRDPDTHKPSRKGKSDEL